MWTQSNGLLASERLSTPLNVSRPCCFICERYFVNCECATFGRYLFISLKAIAKWQQHIVWFSSQNFIELDKANNSILFTEMLCIHFQKKKNISIIGQTVTVDVVCECSLATDVSTGTHATDEARTWTGTQTEIAKHALTSLNLMRSINMKWAVLIRVIMMMIKNGTILSRRRNLSDSTKLTGRV